MEAVVTLDLLDTVKADHYIISTSGRRFKHPDSEALACVITRGRPASDVTPTLWFNYETPTTRPWMDPKLAEQYGYRVCGPEPGSAGISIALSD